MLTRAFEYVRALSRNGFVLIGVTILGAAGSAIGVLSSALGTLPAAVWYVTIAGSFVAAAVVARPKWAAAYQFDGGRWRIEIGRGDLFEQGYPVVITTDQQMSIDLDIVGAHSLVGQLVTRWFDGDSADLRIAVGGNTRSGAAGLLARFRNQSGQSGWLLTLARNDGNGSLTTWNDLAVAHEALWNFLRNENARAVALPVIGAGFARARLPYRALLVMLVLSFHAASLEGRVAPLVRVTMPGDDFDPRVLKALDTLLKALDYKPVAPTRP